MIPRLLPACLVPQVAAQNADDGYAASATGTVSTVVVLSDGKVLIGGSFTQLDGEACSHLCRLRVEGSVDPDFADPDADADGDVTAIVELQ